MTTFITKIINKIDEKPMLYFTCDSDNIISNAVKAHDIHILISGLSGIGKLMSLLYHLKFSPYGSIKNELRYFRNEPTLNKILLHDNIFYLNFAEINNNSDMTLYFDYIRKLNRTINIDGKKKIFICHHVETLNNIYQHQLAYELERGIILFWLICNNTSIILKKIISSCFNIRKKPLSLIEFKSIYYWKIGKIFKKNDNELVSKLYEIYKNNNYNMNYTMKQIIWCIKNNNIETTPIQTAIILPLIKKYGKLSSIEKMEDIRTHLIGLISLNISANLIINTVISYILNTKLSQSIKIDILNIAANASHLCTKSIKHLPILEEFILQIIYKYFT